MNESNSSGQVPAAEKGSDKTEKHLIAGKISTIGWALFFIWIGISFLVDLDMGIGMMGVGVIILGGQFARKKHELKIEMFWIIVGILFLLGGIWELIETDLPLAPILLIVAGLVILLSALGRK